MKVKDLINLLKDLNPEAELGINGLWETPKQFVWDSVKPQSYAPHFKNFIDGTPEEAVISAEKALQECTARKNSNDYKYMLKNFENSKKILPAYVFTYSKI